MSIHEQARAEAEKRMPSHDEGPANLSALSARLRKAFVEGAVWAATRTRVVTVDQLTDALYEATQDPNDIDVPDVAKRLHALLYDPEETR